MLELGSVVDKYVVERRIGRGGTATVYRVRHRDLGVVHALKVLTAADPELAERLRREGRLQAQLRHPNVVAVHDVVEVLGQPALVTELVDGPALDRLLERGAPPLPMIDEIARGVLKGVRAAHLHGLIHRDLKPGNVLLAHVPYPRSDDAPVPKIGDFGLAKRLDAASITRADLLMGTPAYMAPELFQSARAADVRTDVYALGVLLYELCTGVRPYEAADLLALGDVLRRGAWPRVLARSPSLPDRMADTLERAMAHEPADRFPSVDEMLDAWIGTADATVWHPVVGTSAATDTTTPNADPGVSSGGPTPGVSSGGPTPGVSSGGPTPGVSSGGPTPGVLASPAMAADRHLWLPAVAGVFGVGVGAVAVAAVGAGLFGAGLVLWSRPGAPDGLPERVASAQPAVGTSPRMPDPAIPPAPSAQPEPEPEREREPARAPGPAPEAAPAPIGTVVVTGDAERLRLRDPAGQWRAAGPVPPGRYVPAVTFAGDAELVLDVEITVVDGATVTVDCRRAFFSCTAR